MAFIPSFGSTIFQIKWFTILYVITIIPCWVSLYFVIKYSLNKKFKLMSYWGAILFVLLGLPYIFVLVTLDNVHWSLWVVVIIVIALTYKKVVNDSIFEQDKFWDHYADKYDTLLYFPPYVALLKEIVQEISIQKKEGSVLEIGCGTGNIPKLLFQVHPNSYSYLGIDASDAMLEKAKNKNLNFPNANFSYHNIDNDHLHLEKKFDIIIINNVLYALKEHEKILSVTQELLNKNGVIIVSEPLRKSRILYFAVSFIKKLRWKSFFQLLIHLGSFIYITIANVYITKIEHIKKRDFFSEDELASFFNNKYFNIINTKKVYEQQNLMITAIKKI